MKRRRGGIGNAKDEKSAGIGVSNHCCILELPVSVLHAILFRLPIEAIMGCKCVCTTLLNLISEPNFSESYAKDSNTTPLLHFPSQARSCISTYLLEVSKNGNCSRAPIVPELPYWLNLKRNSSFSIVGSCNGLLCLLVHEFEKDDEPRREIICITNPIMGDPVALPEYKRYTRIGHTVRYYFGFDNFSSKFKVLRVVFEGDQIECELFTVRVDNRWRRMSNSLINLHFRSNVITLNGAFYWIPEDDGPIVSISSFDLQEEKSVQISVPSGMVLNCKGYMELVEVFRNELSLVDFTDQSQITLWTTIIKCSSVESWSKIVISKSWIPPGLDCYSFHPVAELRDGKILLAACPENYLISFDIKKKRCSRIDMKGVDMVWTGDIKAYDPTFFFGAPRNVRVAGVQ